jgi:hypothetical protein
LFTRYGYLGYGLSLVQQDQEHVDETPGVGQVKADGGVVQNVANAGEVGFELYGQAGQWAGTTMTVSGLILEGPLAAVIGPLEDNRGLTFTHLPVVETVEKVSHCIDLRL